eukprot:gnl/TRDRNA2_/TRDRNA2_34617_c0_seq1.p1 gnl/TRDRNA2_/TRDRNA2_34617_c0~~gnl/TRDRNA2_/TRDRNA2_34617_c0_seq1.p1  ORF type:complete len:224 (-),score=50.17 gnl/TRDRNA2_/TRDRNA2_34617_c0_seq1:331-1002(-)
MSLASADSKMSDALRFFKDQGLDDKSAHILLRAERLQDKGQIDQALVYYQEVLSANPGCTEARVNVDMIRRMQACTSGSTNSNAGSAAGVRINIPVKAKLRTYSEGNGFCCGFSLERQSDGRSKYQTWCDDEMDCGGQNVPLFFPREQSDQLWSKIIQLLEDGSGMSTEDTTNWREDSWMNGVEMIFDLGKGEEMHYWTNGSSPIEKTIDKHVEKRQKEVFTI